MESGCLAKIGQSWVVVERLVHTTVAEQLVTPCCCRKELGSSPGIPGWIVLAIHYSSILYAATVQVAPVVQW